MENGIRRKTDRKKNNKAAWWKKTASTEIAKMITIRTANTLQKIISIL